MAIYAKNLILGAGIAGLRASYTLHKKVEVVKRIVPMVDYTLALKLGETVRKP